MSCLNTPLTHQYQMFFGEINNTLMRKSQFSVGAYLGAHIVVRGIHLLSIPVSVITILFDTIIGCIPCYSKTHFPLSDSFLLLPIGHLIFFLHPTSPMTGLDPEKEGMPKDDFQLHSYDREDSYTIKIHRRIISVSRFLYTRENLILKHVVSRVVAFSAGIIAAIGFIVEGALALVAACFAVITLGYCGPLNKFAVASLPGSRTLILPFTYIFYSTKEACRTDKRRFFY